ncbi:MAG: DUF4012 domain-containing protein [Bacillota bacterium]
MNTFNQKNNLLRGTGQTDSFVIDLRPSAKKDSGRLEVRCPEKRSLFKSSLPKAPSISLVQEPIKAAMEKLSPVRRSRKGIFSWQKRYRWRLASVLKKQQPRDLRYLLATRRLLNRQVSVVWKELAKKAKKINQHRKSRKEEAEKTVRLVTWYRSLFAFIGALIFIILPIKLLAYFKVLDLGGLKDSVISLSYSAFDNLASASEEAAKMDLPSAGTSFGQAAADFESAQAELARIDSWMLSLAAFSHDPKIRLAANGQKFLAAGKAAAALGGHLSRAADVFMLSESERSWDKLIEAFVTHGTPALERAKEVETVLSGIDSDSLPEEYRDQFVVFRNQASLAVQSLSTLLDSAQEIKGFLGVSQDKRYLLVFQNNSEMRGAGGFFGSYALVDIREGKIRRLEVPAGGPYDSQGGMTAFVRSPKPLQLVNPRWFLWDANWWPDWPMSARSLMWFYEKSGGSSVDGVISFTPDVLEDLLRISGPIDLRPEYDMTVSADDFWQLIQTTVEKDNLAKSHPLEVANVPESPENQPKKIIGDLMAKLMERLPSVLTAENAASLASALEENLSEKNIMLYFADPDLQAKAARYHLDGAMVNAPLDYLMIAHTNIAGQKSDRKMEEEIKHAVTIREDGSIVDTLTIKRTHTGIKREILTGVRNVDWLRVYVPEGSTLISASGFSAPDQVYFDEPEASWESYPEVESSESRETIDSKSGTRVYPENGKTVFANWVMTDPGETSVVTLSYRLPFHLEGAIQEQSWLSLVDGFLNGQSTERQRYSLVWQKQPGAKPATITSSLSMPRGWKVIWSYPESSWDKGEVLDHDRVKAVLMEK